MNEKRFLLIILVLGAMAFMAGCEYDVAQPKWEEPFVNPPTPVITQIVPADVAPPGANTITILGENFDEGTDRNWVYFNKVAAEVLSATTTSIVVRRPNLVAGGCQVKVVPRGADTVAVFGPYGVSAVFARVGNFPENLQLNDLTVDQNDNVYVFQNSPRTVFKIEPNGTTTELLETSAAVIDAKYAKIGGTEKIILLRNNRSINQLDLSVSPPVESEWVKVAKRVSYGDFDSYGNFYSAGSGTDIDIVTANLQEKPLLGVYGKDDISCVRVFDGYVYLAVTLANPAEGEPEIGIWRHPILDANGTLEKTREIVLDWSTTGDYVQSTIKDITFSQDGIMYVATDNANPIFMLHPDGSQDVLYKTILPTYSAQIEWGAGNNLFMLLGGDEWTIVKVEMGAPGAPYYGRTL